MRESSSSWPRWTPEEQLQGALRRALLEGDLTRAEALGGANPELRTLLRAIEHISHGDAERGAQLLESLGKQGATMRWLTWVWQAAASVRTGQLGVAKTAADTALAMTGPGLDAYSRATTVALRAAVDYLLGDITATRRRVLEAAEQLQSTNDPVPVAELWLFWGRLMLASGHARQGLRALSQAAQLVDQDWAALPLAREAMLSRRPGEAMEILAPFAVTSTRPDVACLAALVEELRQGRVALEAVSEYLWLTARPLSDWVAGQVDGFLAEQSCLVLQDLFVWDLALEGQRDLARKVLDSLARRKYPPERIAIRHEALSRLRRDVGVLAVVERAARSRNATGRLPPESDTDAELFWIRRLIGSGEVPRAVEALRALESSPKVQHDRIFLEAVRDGRLPLEVAKDYVWIRERPATQELLAAVRAIVGENMLHEDLRLVAACDLVIDGFRSDATPMLEDLAQEAEREEVRAVAEQALIESRAAGTLVQPPPPLVLRSITPPTFKDFVFGRTRWPSVLDHNSLLFSGEIHELPAVVVSSARLAHLQPGEAMHRQGETGDLLYLLHSGEVQAARTFRGPHHLCLYGEGMYLGEIGTLSGLPNTASLVAATRCEIGVIGRRSLQESTQRSSAPAVLKMLREIYFETAMRVCPLYNTTDEEKLRALMTTQGRWRILQPKEEVRFEEGTRLGVVISGIGRVVATLEEEETLGFVGPGDLVVEVDPMVCVRAEKVLTLAVFGHREVAGLSAVSRGALATHLSRGIAALPGAPSSGELSEDQALDPF
jgi:CRP-like cAMP-binding protein